VLKVGLTGGIGSGKSEVVGRLAARGAVVVDADVLAREVVAPGTPGLAALADEFGPRVLGSDGALDRAAMAERVFNDPAARERLNALVHPLVRQATLERFAAAPADAVVVNDVPLLVEAGLAPTYDMVVVVTAPVETRVARLVGRGMSEPNARARISAQASDAERTQVADHVVCNDGTLADLDAAVDRLWTELRRRNRRTPDVG
jgi:dephospho-CoA kinase